MTLVGELSSRVRGGSARINSWWHGVILLVAFLAAVVAPSLSATAATVLYSFCAETNCTDGQQPRSVLIMDSSGNLYGTTSAGGFGTMAGASGAGTVFQLVPNASKKKWTLNVLYSFCAETFCADGETPKAGLVMDGSGNLYGTTTAGGATEGGTVFELAPNATGKHWTYKVLHSFCPDAEGPEPSCADGESPSGLIMDRSGSLYGTTEEAGANLNGTVFQLAPNATKKKWTLNVLYSFCAKSECADGSSSAASLIMDRSGHLYGTTTGGGAIGADGIQGGTVFELAPNATKKHWTHTVLYSFCAKTNCNDGRGPGAGLIMDRSGNLYGTTGGGGPTESGTAFQLMPNAAKTKWTPTVLYSFCAKTNCTDGVGTDSGLIMDSSGNLYGTTEGGGAAVGTVFQLAPNATKNKWTHKVLYNFCAQTNCADGEEPFAGLIMDSSGNLYGTTYGGGVNGGGTVFKVGSK